MTIVLCLGVISVDAADADRVAEFENTIRPLLIKHCIECHGPKKSESGLRLDSRVGILKGGVTGPAVVPGRPEQSVLLQAIRHQDGLEMPPDVKLTDREIGALARWIENGAAWPEGMTLAGTGPALRSGPITDEERSFWSLQTITDPRPPDVESSAHLQNDIDRFVHARLTEAGLQMRSPVSKRSLIRRATFDLTGLPPTPEEVGRFLNDNAPDAFEKVITRLLTSRHYGERWGRHWLDVVRYADTAGETGDYPTPLSYKYRNWVIDAFNADMSYDQFVREQIAGDLLANRMIAEAGCSPDSCDVETLERYEQMLTATGFIAISRRFGFDVENYHHLTIQDTIDTLGQAVLGLTLGCARCHDHKYDPVNTNDYYAWYGVFESTRYSFPGSEEKKRSYDSFSALPPSLAQKRKADLDARIAGVEQDIKRLTEHRNSLEAKLKASSPSDELATAPNELEATAQKLTSLTNEQLELKSAQSYDLVYGAVDQDDPKDANIRIRGERHELGNVVPRRNLEILGKDLLPAGAGSGRLQMAEWLTRKSNPLTARVMVNRIWQHHFGRGLVDTENDFGTRGERPSHPELLDWLASRFIESDWSVKGMHRLIMSSAAYQQSSEYDEVAARLDPDARLLWRFNLRRLSAEEIRDAMLFVSGELDTSMGGPHPFPAEDTWGFTQHAPFYGIYPSNHRSVYLMQQRLKRHPFLSLFDGADVNVPTARRQLTTVPTQALYLMNSEFVQEQATKLAQRIIKQNSPTEKVQFAYGFALGREAADSEIADVSQFVNAYRQSLNDSEDAEIQAWAGFARTLLTRNEFLFVD